MDDSPTKQQQARIKELVAVEPTSHILDDEDGSISVEWILPKRRVHFTVQVDGFTCWSLVDVRQKPWRTDEGFVDGTAKPQNLQNLRDRLN